MTWLTEQQGYSNILTFRMQDRIVPAATFGLHENIIHFDHGSFAPPTSAAETIVPNVLFATTDGRLGMIGELTDPAAKILTDLQRNLGKTYSAPGAELWQRYRQGGTPLVRQSTAGFIDGDLYVHISSSSTPEMVFQ